MKYLTTLLAGSFLLVGCGERSVARDKVANDATPPPEKQSRAPYPVSTNMASPGVEAPLAANEKSFVNSLGMKFAPVPGTAVMFSVWDTRVQDYQVFAAATKRTLEAPPVNQGPTHPAVDVSWGDALDFCQWLTQKERSEGKLSTNQSYRLPRDTEWSVAAGLPDETGHTPSEKHGKVKNLYPWGTQWPPPRGAGNYPQSLKVDDYKETSPVGSFTANRLGLYDMGGNVGQWCYDAIDEQSSPRQRVVRGSSWYSSGLYDIRVELELSSRSVGSSDVGYPHIGFRCVLVNGE